ncbi:helix-turn-helix domain-containing protein [Cupriavidus oxalaticus]|uniref:helix-turn-helix domain-containing protein n=1 Tax=Cupriavidus oxalaticus TaxID=96344 RepID=UPI003F73C9C1
MSLRNNFGRALRAARKLRNLPQEALDSVSSRTYVSTLERGLKSPTLDKIAQLAEALNVHPLTLLTFSFVGKQSEQRLDRVLQQIKAEYGLLVAEDSD